MEIEVGDYIRNKYGIAKIIRLDSLDNIAYTDKKDIYVAILMEKIKHSKNIIDLIKVGDYVNGHKIVNEIYGEDDNNLYFEIEGGFNKAKYIGEEEIKSIVTKEQFESIKYEV